MLWSPRLSGSEPAGPLLGADRRNWPIAIDKGAHRCSTGGCCCGPGSPRPIGGAGTALTRLSPILQAILPAAHRTATRLAAAAIGPHRILICSRIQREALGASAVRHIAPPPTLPYVGWCPGDLYRCSADCTNWGRDDPQTDYSATWRVHCLVGLVVGTYSPVYSQPCHTRSPLHKAVG